MAGYLPSKLKRKDLEDVNDDFSDFSLSSPATKIRRLDAELPPIIEDEDCEIPVDLEQLLRQGQGFDCVNSSGGIRIEELPENEERAIVLFQPPNPLLHSLSNFSVTVDPHLLSGLKNQVLLSSRSNAWKLPNNESSEGNNSTDCCLAVVPWVPSQLPSASASASEVSSQVENLDMMDVQEVEETSMDVEDGPVVDQRNNGNEFGGMSGFHQWQQQHCMIPQPPHSTTTPLVWYR